MSRHRTSAVPAGAAPVAHDGGLLIIRAPVGLLLVGHGVRKLFGWFGGAGLTGTAQYFDALGYHPANVFAVVGGVTELLAGLLLALGLLTPLASAMIIGDMINAASAAWSHGLWHGDGGYEYPLVLAIAGAALAYAGPGRVSLDRGRPWAEGGIAPALFSVALGVVAGVVLLAVRLT